ENATTTLIDCASFQVSAATKLHLCKVAMPEFTLPELQGRRLDQITRTPNHDAFGLAVLIFNLLFMVRDPFAGHYLSPGFMRIEQAILEFRFAYSKRTRETSMEPPPNVPLLPDIPVPLADAFERAFGQAGVDGARPTAADWINLLQHAESQISRCTQNAG